MSLLLAPSHPPARGIVAALACLLVVGFAAGELRVSVGNDFWALWIWCTVGGLILGVEYWHAYRGTGFVPYAATGAAIACICAAVAGWCDGTVAVAAVCLGFAFARLAVFVSLFGLNTLGFRPFFGMCLGLLYVGGVVPIPAVSIAIIVTGVAVFAWYAFFRPWFELTCEPVLWWMYKIRSAGPGVREMPPWGPCLVIANHASWLDPLFLAKVLPRRTTPMMTSKFYDKRVIGWLVRRFGVIRVPEKAVKQDTPELREAIAALDRGECVVIFPEGFLRRSDDKPLKRFGRGVWRILTERPNTPVFTCWIEGAWGSYCSYFNGTPTVNKKRDRRRPIGIGVSAAVTVPADVLANHLQARVYLMNLVLGARAHLGLKALPAVELPTREDE